MILEAPGAEEESYNIGHQKYGVPIVGRSGWALKFALLAPAGFVEIEQKERGWPTVKKWNTFVMNVLMCRPPNNKINSPEGKKALVCCSNSAKNLLAYLLTQRPDRTVIPLGGTALALLTGQATIGPYRGRVLPLTPSCVEPLSLEQTLKLALKGIKAPPEAEQHLKIVKLLLQKQKMSLLMAPARIRKIQLAELKTQALPHLQIVNMLLKKQRQALKQAKSVP
jgi:predicted Zn-ribbon and HTH transcriptional regulator